MRLLNAVGFLLLILASLTPNALASKPRKHPATAKEPLEFAIEVLGARTPAPTDELAREIAADSGSCAWSVVGKGPQAQRLYVGLFQQEIIAKDYGNRLIRLGLITGFRVEPAYELRAFTRARSVADCKQLRYAAAESTTSPGTETGGPFESISRDADEAGLSGDVAGSEPGPVLATDSARDEARVSSDGNIFLPRMSFSLELSLRVAVESRGPIPQPNPAARAIYELTDRIPGADDGGLWLSGDVEEATDRLRWILGQQDSGLINSDSHGRVNLDLNLLARAAGAVEQDGPEGWLKVGEYLSANEGLLLLAQLVSSQRRYCLHIGDAAPTAGGSVPIQGSVNLDNKFDSRINPYRKRGDKVPVELPPPGFDALIAMNPAALWFNLNVNEIVPVGEIMFHELAEARAKVDMGFDYLPVGPFPGAHGIALEREERLKAQRSGSYVVISAGQNILFRSQTELKRLIEIRSLTGAQ
jgi:hypothetical protein